MLTPVPLFDPPAGGGEDRSSVPTGSSSSAARSGGEGVFAGDPPAGSEATEGGVEHPLPRSEHGGRVEGEGKTESLQGRLPASPKAFIPA